jgi:O-antigen ligase
MSYLFFITQQITYKRFLLLWAVLGLVFTDTTIAKNYPVVSGLIFHVFGISAFLGFFLSLLLNKFNFRFRLSIFEILMILYLLIVIVSMIANNATNIFHHFIRIAIPLGFGLLYIYVFSNKDFKSIIYAITIFGLVNVLMSYPLFFSNYLDIDTSLPSSGFFNDRNGFVRYLSIVNVYFLIEFLQSKRTFRKIIFGFFIFLIFGGVLIQFSRSGYIVYFISTAAVLFMSGLKTVRKVAIIILPILLILFASFTIARIRSDKMNVFNASDIGRIYMLKAGINMIKAHPIKGIGYEMTESRLKEFADKKIPGIFFVTAIHNWFIANWAEMGIFGLIVFCLLNYFLLHDTLKYFYKLGFIKGKHFLFIFISLLILMIDGLFLPNYDYENIYWIIVALGAIILRDVPEYPANITPPTACERLR